MIKFACDLLQFGLSLVGFFMSAYMYVSLDDMRRGDIEPMELSESLEEVRSNEGDHLQVV